MEALEPTSRSYLRTLLVLGRASNLPTVWSNCLAGWFLGEGGSFSGFVLLCIGATCLYTGGMYLNDAFDVEFDRQHRPERPIPSGAIGLGEVWGFGAGWLVIGTVLLAMFGIETAILTILLVISILLYDLVHKAIAFSPFLMALCRFFLFLVAASASDLGVTGLAIWSAFALAAYIVGLSYVAKSESTWGPLKYWPCLLLLVPVVLAYLVNKGPYKPIGMIFSVTLVVWVVRNLSFTFWSGDKNIPRTVSGLLAGIVLVDLLAVAGGSVEIALVFMLLFVGALLFQRFVPAT
ncbi:MAG TPA: UbiA family prenyltransferase [Candidatus Kapabacteria bacterium]|nr:UbiA family prenyltransferase [Candidatus Kapabacteria bacterium]